MACYNWLFLGSILIRAAGVPIMVGNLAFLCPGLISLLSGAAVAKGEAALCNTETSFPAVYLEVMSQHHTAL